MRTGVSTASSLLLFCLALNLGIAATAGTAEAAKKKNSAAPAKTASRTTPVPVKEWGPYLDVAFELTYWEKGEIREWRERSEKEIGQSLAAFIASWKEKLSTPADTAGTGREEKTDQAYRERDYLRLAIAQTVDYLQTDNLESLAGAEQVIERMKGKVPMPEVAFWSGFIKALKAVENRDSEGFVTEVFDLWNNSVLYIEQVAMAGSARTASAKSIPYLYRNVVNLVVKRGIIDRKLDNVNALGPLFLMLNERRMEEGAGEGEYLTTLVRRIADGFVAPDSDRYRLNFTVAMIEARRLQKVAAAKLDAGGMTEEAQRVFEQSRLFDDYAVKWAASRRSSGAAAAVTDYLDITSFAIQRLPDNVNAPAYGFFATLPSHDGSTTLLKAMDIYNDMAAYSTEGWERAGFKTRPLYVNATHRLWRAIMELALWTGDFYLMQLNAATEPHTIFTVAAPLQGVLNSYLDFMAAQTSRGYPDVIPDSACFGAAEAAEKLAHAYLKTYTYSTDSAVYNRWFLHRLQAAELFPLDTREIGHTAALLKRDGRYNLFLDYFLPLAERFKGSGSVRKWIGADKSAATAAVREYATTVDARFAAAATGDGADSGKDAVMRQLREELQRKPDHPVHRLLKEFYVEEMQKATPYTQLMRDTTRLDRGL